MIVISRFISELLLIILQLYYYILIARIILSWFMVGGSANPTLMTIFQILVKVTEPLLAPLRKMLPAIRLGMGYLDLSPLVLLILIQIIRQIIFRSLYF